MIIVSDSSPLIVLAKIGQLNLLPIIYTTVLITPRVADEIMSRKRPLEDRIIFDPLPEWMPVKSPIGTMSLSDLDPGEAEAIQLATELGADALLGTVVTLRCKIIAFHRDSKTDRQVILQRSIGGNTRLGVPQRLIT